MKSLLIIMLLKNLIKSLPENKRKIQIKGLAANSKEIKKDFIFESVSNLKGVGNQLTKYLKKRKIEKIKDIILNLPYSETDRSKLYKLNELEIGKIQTIKVKVIKLNFLG